MSAHGGHSGQAILTSSSSGFDPIETCPAGSANRCRLGQHNVCAHRWNLAAESGEVAKRRDTRKEEIGAALYGRKSWKALYLSSDWPLRDRHVVASVLSSDHRIAFIA